MTTHRWWYAGVGRVAPILGLCGLLLGCAEGLSLQRGEELIAANRWEEAVQFYMDAANKEPQNIEVRLSLARAMLEASESVLKPAQEAEKAGRVDEAAVLYRRALAYNAENRAAQEGLDRLAMRSQISTRLTRARERMQKAEWRGALADVAAVLRVAPDDPEAQSLQQEISLRMKADTLVPKPEADGEQTAALLFSTKPVTLRFRDTDIKEVLDVFARTSGINIFTDESLPAKRVTTFFKDLSLREAFNLILSSNRLFAKRVAPNTVIVVPDNPGKRQQYEELTVQTFYLTDADAKVAVNLVRTILNTRQVFVNEKLNALVVRETPDKIELARKLLEANDRGVAEVEIDIEVLEVDYQRLENLGIDLSPRTYNVTLTFPPTIPLNSFASTISKLTTVGFTNPSLILNLIKNDSNTKILANPTVRILDRQKARLLIGQRRPFLISSLTSVPAVAGTTGTGGTTGTVPTGAVTTTQTNVEYRDIGLKLTLTPTIHLNGEVTVELNFEISAVGPAIADVTGAALLPPVNTRNLDTFVKVKHGETRLLGGLLQRTESTQNSRIPFLSDLPGLGRLFTSPNEDFHTEDVLISLTPRIVKILDRPEPEIESFPSGTADSFGAQMPAIPAITPPVAPPTPRTPTVPGGFGSPGGGSAPSPRP